MYNKIKNLQEFIETEVKMTTSVYCVVYGHEITNFSSDILLIYADKFYIEMNPHGTDKKYFTIAGNESFDSNELSRVVEWLWDIEAKYELEVPMDLILSDIEIRIFNFMRDNHLPRKETLANTIYNFGLNKDGVWHAKQLIAEKEVITLKIKLKKSDKEPLPHTRAHLSYDTLVVSRQDGKELNPEDMFWALNLRYDPHAVVALFAYAESIAKANTTRSIDAHELAVKMEKHHQSEVKFITTLRCDIDTNLLKGELVWCISVPNGFYIESLDHYHKSIVMSFGYLANISPQKYKPE